MASLTLFSRDESVTAVFPDTTKLATPTYSHLHRAGCLRRLPQFDNTTVQNERILKQVISKRELYLFKKPGTSSQLQAQCRVATE